MSSGTATAYIKPGEILRVVSKHCNGATAIETLVHLRIDPTR